jgi:hypothetical protein
MNRDYRSSQLWITWSWHRSCLGAENRETGAKVIHKVACIRDGVKAQKSGTDIDDIISEAEVVLKKLGERMC